MIRYFAAALGIITLSLAASSTVNASVLYHVSEVSSQTTSASGYGINDYGEAVGVRYPTEGFLYRPSVPQGVTGSTVRLGSLVTDPENQVSNSTAYSINQSGQITGWASSDNNLRAYVWTPTTPNGSAGSMFDLGTVPGGASSAGQAINKYGQVVGSSAGGNFQHPFLWTPTSPQGTSGAMIDLGDLPGGADNGAAAGINSYGQVVGSGSTANGGRAFLWTPSSQNGVTGSMLEMAGFPGATGSAGAHAINASGQVIVIAGVGSANHSFLWTPSSPNGTSGSAIDIGVLPGNGRNETYALGMNDLGDVVGFSQGPNVSYVAPILRSLNGDIIDLNTVLDSSGAAWELVEARAINNKGQIVGIGFYDPPGARPPGSYAFLLTPVPEPVGLAMFASAGVFLSRRRRRSSRRT